LVSLFDSSTGLLVVYPYMKCRLLVLITKMGSIT
jgi:hypothetical protein